MQAATLMNGKIWQKQEVSEATWSNHENKIPEVVISSAAGSRNFHPRSASLQGLPAEGRGKRLWISSPGLKAALVMSM